MDSDATIAISERTVKGIFQTYRDRFTFDESDNNDFGPFTLDWAIGFRLVGGNVDLLNGNRIRLSELDVKWTTLRLTLGVNIPKICTPRVCIPFTDICTPSFCVFENNPDIFIPVNLSGLVRSELSGTVRPITVHRIDPQRQPNMTDLDAEDAGIPNKWQVFFDVINIDLDLIDIADTVGDILDAAIDAAVNGFLSFLPGWVKDFISSVLGSIVDLVREILDIPDDALEFISNTIGRSLGYFNKLVELIIQFLSLFPPIEIENPYPLDFVDNISFVDPPEVPEPHAMIPVKIPIENLSVETNDNELILKATVGS